jgi:hypothetical protein
LNFLWGEASVYVFPRVLAQPRPIAALFEITVRRYIGIALHPPHALNVLSTAASLHFLAHLGLLLLILIISYIISLITPNHPTRPKLRTNAGYSCWSLCLRTSWCGLCCPNRSDYMLWMGAPAGRRISSITSSRVEGARCWQVTASILAAETSSLVGIYNILLLVGAFILVLPLIIHAIRNEKDARRRLYRSLRPFVRSTRRQLCATACASCEDSEAIT